MECRVALNLACTYIIVFAVHLRWDFCDALYLLRVGFHAFFAENGAIKCDHEVFYLLFSVTKDKAIVAYLIH